ncbi:hypothetical protein IDH17_04350 [Pelagibacterales bacterium SAG-MED37]|nr:hypothetical protein [Pelagibacterales bacterium SAG-MED37]
MFKKILTLIFILNFLSSCEYKPIYSSSNKADYRIIITDLSGDKKLNKYIVENLERNSQKNSVKIINIKINSKYSREVLAKNTLGSTTDYQARAITEFEINKNEITEKLIIDEKFNYQKILDSYEEKSYEQTIKSNLATSISQKLILRLSIIE